MPWITETVDFYPEKVVNGQNRVQMADKPLEVNDHITLSEQVGGVSSAGQDLLSACRQSASSLNSILVLARQIWHLILRENKSNVIWREWECWKIMLFSINPTAAQKKRKRKRRDNPAVTSNIHPLQYVYIFAEEVIQSFLSSVWQLM